jgi:hypothetical protein
MASVVSNSFYRARIFTAVIPDIGDRESLCSSFRMDPRQPLTGMPKRGEWIGLSCFTDDEMLAKTPRRACRFLPFQKTSQTIIAIISFLYLGGEVYYTLK